jgi:hypothetical protein
MMTERQVEQICNAIDAALLGIGLQARATGGAFRGDKMIVALQFDPNPPKPDTELRLLPDDDCSVKYP